MSEKMWGAEPFWGLGYEWDPDWVLTDRQKDLRATLISLCEKELRANAKRSDDELLFPRRNLELLGEHGFLALTVPEEYGGLGENHVAFAMTCETIARYGCAFAVTPLISAEGLIRRNEKTTRLLVTGDDDASVVAAQIFGARPAAMAEAAKIGGRRPDAASHSPTAL